MVVFLVGCALYLAIPAFAILISGRMLTWQGWLIVMLVWPVLWMLLGPEELP